MQSQQRTEPIPGEVLKLRWPFRGLQLKQWVWPMYPSSELATGCREKGKKVCWGEICMNWRMMWCKGRRRKKRSKPKPGLRAPQKYLGTHWKTWFGGEGDSFNWRHTGTFLFSVTRSLGSCLGGLQFIRLGFTQVHYWKRKDKITWVHINHKNSTGEYERSEEDSRWMCHKNLKIKIKLILFVNDVMESLGDKTNNKIHKIPEYKINT